MILQWRRCQSVALAILAVTAACHLACAAELQTVNGSIELAPHARVSGSGIDTVSGGIELGPNAHVDGGIHVRKPGGFFNFGAEEAERPPD